MAQGEIMIVWSGWGFLVAVFFVVAFFIGIPLGGMISADESTASGAAFMIAGLLAGLGSFLLARQIESKPGRAFIDEATQQRIEVRPSAGSLFFIPTRYWAYIGPVVGIGLGILMMTAPPRPTETDPLPSADSAPVVATPQ